MHPGTSILQAEGLSFSYCPAPALPLFNALSLALLPGVTFIGGEEGTGKTTLLQLLAGVLPSSGFAFKVYACRKTRLSVAGW